MMVILRIFMPPLAVSHRRHFVFGLSMRDSCTCQCMRPSSYTKSFVIQCLVKLLVGIAQNFKLQCRWGHIWADYINLHFDVKSSDVKVTQDQCSTFLVETYRSMIRCQRSSSFHLLMCF